MRRRRWIAALVAAALAATGAVIGIHALFGTVTKAPPSCSVGSGATALVLAPDQAADAATIAAVAMRMRLADHAVTIALATALQESKLHNYPFGDRDSVGLFQQRPSQGWGPRAQLLTPAFAAAAFYEHLRQVPGWQSLPVAEAAQAVQHSAFGSAYAQWEEEARAMARALTGEVPAGMGCQFAKPSTSDGAALVALADRELGVGVLRRTGGTPGQDWTVAEWIVGHALAFGVVAVEVRGQRWTPDSATWSPAPGSGSTIYRLAPRATG
jgi:hypothetical protein